jgi:ketosteroid isomerase-like protein
MTDSLNTFFAAWSETDADARRALIEKSVTSSFSYSDPRSGERVSSLDAVTDYVGMFSANAPGWTAEVVKADVVNGYARAIVRFGGKGPDGSDMNQLGTYFADIDDGGKLTFLAGFVGTGEPS